MDLKEIIEMSGAKVVEPKAEPKVEPQQANNDTAQQANNATEPKAEPKAEPKVEPKAEPKNESKFEISSFNKTFESEYESEDTIRELLSNGSKYKELETELGARDEKIRELSSAADNAVDPMSLFANEDEYVRQQFLKNNGDKYNESSLDYLTNLSPSKIEKLDSWDALSYQLLIDGADTLEGGKAGVEAILKDKYGIDEDTPLSEVDQLTRNKIALDSKKAKESLKSLYSDIKIPEKVDWEGQKTATKDQWSTPLQAIVDGITEIQLADGVSLSVDDAMKNGMYDSALNGLISGQVGVSEDAASRISGQIRSQLLEKNMDKVVKVIQANAEEKAKEKYRERVHNDGQLNEDVKAEGSDTRSTNQKALDNVLK